MSYRLEQVYDDLAPAVTGYLRGHGSHDPEGLCGDVFVGVAGGLASFRGDAAALRRWVFTIAHHRLVDELKSAHRTRERATGGVLDQPIAAASDGFDVDLVSALRHLTKEQRDVVVLRYVADLPIRDVAKILGKRTGAIKMLQARGLAELRVHLDGTAEQA